MTEKLTINLTEGDVDVRPAHGADPTKPLVINYVMKCPLCGTEFWLTRNGTNKCDCDIEWRVEVKVKGIRALDDDEKFQMPLPMRKSDD